MDSERVRRDFSSFADPATEVSVSDHKVSWVHNREVVEATLVSDGSDLPQIIFKERKFGYREFFASEHMADLRRLAETFPRYVSTLPGYVSRFFVEGRASAENEAPVGSLSLLASMVAPDEKREKTRVIFLRGRAGDGKSALLTRAAVEQAEAYLRGDTSWLYFYVDAQGSSLARIDEVMAKVTQDVSRVGFTYHAVPTLAALGLLVPIVDGFDELLGIGGYRDAFSSLALFLGRMFGRGALVASARSTFYQYTTFGQQAARFTSDDLPLEFEISPVELEPWSDAEASKFLELSGVERSVDSLRELFGSRASEVLSSPFLLSSFVQNKELVATAVEDVSIVRSIVEAMIEREMVEKLLDPQGKPLLTREQHLHLLGALAEEMWWEESRQLDERTFTTIAELTCEELGLSGVVAERFLDRMPTYALLARTESPKRIFFRHEFYFGVFLGASIARQVLSGVQINDYLNRATISSVVADEVAASIRIDGGGRAALLVEALAARKHVPSSVDVSNQNAGTLFGSLIREFGEAELNGSVLRGAVLSGLDLKGSRLCGVRFEDCGFFEVDLRECKWTDVSMHRSSWTLVRVSDQSVLRVAGLEVPGGVNSLRYFAPDGSQKELYSPSSMRALLERLGCDLVPDGSPELELTDEGRAIVEELDRLLQVVQRTLYFSENDFKNRRIQLETDLGRAFRLLEKHGLIAETKRPIQGHRTIYRLVARPDDIRLGEAGIFASESIKQFWAELRESTAPV